MDVDTPVFVFCADFEMLMQIENTRDSKLIVAACGCMRVAFFEALA
jgi:hypothetical protein